MVRIMCKNQHPKHFHDLKSKYPLQYCCINTNASSVYIICSYNKLFFIICKNHYVHINKLFNFIYKRSLKKNNKQDCNNVARLSKQNQDQC